MISCTWWHKYCIFPPHSLHLSVHLILLLVLQSSQASRHVSYSRPVRLVYKSCVSWRLHSFILGSYYYQRVLKHWKKSIRSSITGLKICVWKKKSWKFCELSNYFEVVLKYKIYFWITMCNSQVEENVLLPISIH